MTQAKPPSKTVRQYVFVFWSILFHDAGTLALVNDLRDRGVAVKVIDPVQSNRARYKQRDNHFSLYADSTIEEAMRLLPSAACVVLPHDKCALDLLLAQPEFELFIRNAAENDTQFVGYIELVAQFALDKTAEKSFDWVYPLDDSDLDAFLINVAWTLEGQMKQFL